MAAASFHAPIPPSHLDLSSLRHEVRAAMRDPDSGRPPSVDVDLVVTELVANAIDHTDAPAIDLTVVAEGPTLRVRSPTTAVPRSRARQRVAESGARAAACGSAALSAELRLQTENGRSVVVAELVGERQPAGEARQLKQGTVSLAPRRRSDPPPASSRSAAASSTARPADEMKLVPVRSMPSAACGNIGKPLRKRRSGVGVDLSDDAEKVRARFVDDSSAAMSGD